MLKGANKIQCGQQAGVTAACRESGCEQLPTALAFGAGIVYQPPPTKVMQGTSHTHVGRTSLMVPTKPVKQRSVAPFVTSVDYLGSICYSSLLLNLWWETYSHFQMMLLQRMQTLLHIKCRQSTENVTLMGTRSCIHTYMHGIIVFVPKPIKVIFQTICYFGLSALLLASISMAN